VHELAEAPLGRALANGRIEDITVGAEQRVEILKPPAPSGRPSARARVRELSGLYRPYRTDISVDLPAPFSPSSACTSPGIGQEPSRRGVLDTPQHRDPIGDLAWWSAATSPMASAARATVRRPTGLILPVTASPFHRSEWATITAARDGREVA
jgi:hypothetical protein